MTFAIQMYVFFFFFLVQYSVCKLKIPRPRILQHGRILGSDWPEGFD